MQVLPNSAEHHLGAAITALGSDGFAPALYAWLARSFEFDNITALAFFQTRRPEILYSRAQIPAVHERLESAYVSGAYLLDPFHELHVSRVPEGLYRLRDFAPDQFHRNPYFLDYYANTTMVDELAFVGYPAPGVSVQVCLGRDARSNARFSSREMARARQVSPIVVALIERHWAELSPQGEHAEGDVTRQLIDSLDAAHGVGLSRRQAEVALMILRGHSSVSIGLGLGISPQTVKVFRKQLYRKCGISSQAELFTLLLPLLGQ